MLMSECMTNVIAFHQSNHRYFKNLYTGLVKKYWVEYFPYLLSYSRFLRKMAGLFIPMCAYISNDQRKANRYCVCGLHKP